MINVNIGCKIHHLVVLDIYKHQEKNGKYMSYTKCLCDCGKITHTRLSRLKSGTTKSCGCLRSDRMRKMNTHNKFHIIHNLSSHPIYQVWYSMKRRCNKTNSKFSICQEWYDDINTFYDWSINNGYTDKSFLKLKKTKKYYYPNNCYWYIPKTKLNLTVNNVTKTIKEWTKDYKCIVDTSIIVDRLSRNWDEKDAIFIDKHQKKHFAFTQNNIVQWIQQCDNVCLNNYKILDNNREIDIYIPKLNLGIEYCGLYWHNELSPQQRLRNYHYSKYCECKNRGIYLITIFSDEWNNRQNQVKNFLKSILGINKKIGGRCCEVQIINKQDGQQFIDINHIQGQKRRAKVYFGLLYNEELVGCMSLNYHHRNNKTSSIVLDRMCFKDGLTVLGGASKLFKNALDWCKKNNYEKIISWSDNRWSNGKIYDLLGFSLDGELRPDYSYVQISNPKKRVPKQSMKKSNIGCPSHMTEKEYCKQLGFARIWDCGKKRYKFIV